MLVRSRKSASFVHVCLKISDLYRPLCLRFSVPGAGLGLKLGIKIYESLLWVEVALLVRAKLLHLVHKVFPFVERYLWLLMVFRRNINANK